ncbi:g1915 [Coccomyxa elongata]
MGILRSINKRRRTFTPEDSIRSVYVGVLGTKTYRGGCVWTPYKTSRHGGVKRIGIRTYPTEREAAKAYDEHMYNELGHKAVLNFDAKNYERKRAEMLLKQEQSRLHRLLINGRFPKAGMRSQALQRPLNLSLDKLSISKPPAEAVDTNLESSDKEDSEQIF